MRVCPSAPLRPCVALPSNDLEEHDVHKIPPRPPARAPKRAAKPDLPGLSARSVRRLHQIRTVRAVLRNVLASTVGVGVAVAAGIAVPAYAQSVTTMEVPESQVLKVVATAPLTVERDTYTVLAPPPLQWPLASLKVASGYGPRVAPCAGCSTFHKGVDFDPGYGAPVHAIAAGVVIETNSPFNAALGVHVGIEHVIGGQRIVSYYGHMQHGSMPLAVGDTVKVGQVIGLVGSTGESTGPHLHFEVWVGGAPVNPLGWMHARLG